MCSRGAVREKERFLWVLISNADFSYFFHLLRLIHIIFDCDCERKRVHTHRTIHALPVWTISLWNFEFRDIYAPRHLRLRWYVCLRLYAIYVVEARFWCISVDRNIFISVCVFFAVLCSSSLAQAKNAIKIKQNGASCVWLTFINENHKEWFQK